MIRTQIYLDEDTHKDLSRLARQEKESMAKVARDILREGIDKKRKLDTSGKSVIKKLLAVEATGGPSDLSENLDHYLYGGAKQHE